MEARAVEAADVLVVGAGPVGMMTALAAVERGLGVRIVDQYRRAALHSYALALHPGSLRLLEEYGLADKLVDHGHRLEHVDVYLGPQQVATLDLAEVGGAYPFVLVLPQSLLESALEQRLTDAAVQVEWERSLLSFDESDEGITALIAQMPEAHTARVQATYLVGADGQSSLVRRLMGTRITDAGPPLSYGLLEFEAPVEAADRMRLVFTDESIDVLWPLSGERARWGVQLLQDEVEPQPPLLWEHVGRRAPWFDSSACRAEWWTSVAFQPGLSRSCGRKRAWLAGDAAHSAPPAGVQSMNVGLREGHDLGRRLAAILRGERQPRLLRYYHEEREREWKMLLGVQDRLQTLPGAPDWARRIGPRLVSSLPASGRDLNVLLGQAGLRLQWLRGEKRRSGS